ncbi:MAG TPA: ATP synthase F1 subunit epsilon [Candidatus Binataceae bacterium]|nr:ATP synthase F1 subunit epsilon [Candidatus Binataceae bacterium]
MATTFPLQLVTPTGVVFEGEVEEVTATGPLGQFGVLAEHINFITSLLPGALEIKRVGGATEIWVISGGLAEVKDGAMTVLASGAEAPSSIDRAAAAADEQAADQKIAAMSFYDAEYPAAEDALLLARARATASDASARAGH